MTTAFEESVDTVTGEVVDIGANVPVLSAATKAEIDTQIATAKRFPRSVTAARRMAMDMAIINEDVAASCCYTLKRSGKAIKGPSIRLAEIMVQAWGNIRAETRVLASDHLTVESEAVCWDLERNVAIRAAVKRRITDKHGRRYNDDMVVTTGNAAASVAFRNAVFRVIPKTFVHEVYDACEKVAVGDIKTLAERRGAALAYFARFGVNAEQVCKRMSREAVDQLTLDDIAQLKAMCEQIKRGDLTIEDAFAEEPEPPAERPTATSIAGDLAKQVEDMDRAINKDKPTENATPTADEEARRQKLVDQAKSAGAKEPKPAPKIKCSPGKKGCSDEGSHMTIDGKRVYVCSEHARQLQAT